MGSSPPRRWRTWLARAALALVALLLALAGAEAWVRHAMPLHVFPIEGTGLRLAEDPALAYEYLPGVEPRNNLGFRDRDFGPKEAGVLRVAVLGDSIAYGFHTAVDETPAAAMQAALRAATAGAAQRWQVYNFGVEGYSILNQAAQLEAHVLPLEPDFVVLLACLNDWDPASVEFRGVLELQGEQLRPWFDPGLSWAGRALLRLHLVRHLRWRLAPPDPVPVAHSGRPHPVHDPIEAHYRERDFYGPALRSMAARLAERGIPFAVLLVPYDPATRPEAVELYRARLEELRAHCQGGRCEVLDGLEALGLEGDPQASLAVFGDDDLHPTVHGSALLGQAMARHVAARAAEPRP